MASTRITVIMDVHHEQEVDLPARAAQYLERTLSDVEGIGNVSVVLGEIDDLVWMPHETHRRGRHPTPPRGLLAQAIRGSVGSRREAPPAAPSGGPIPEAGHEGNGRRRRKAPQR
jgi:hypothetical protein